MINKQRVMRFRALIQFVIFLLVIVPVILIITLCFRMVGMLDEITVYLERTSGMSFVETPEPTEATSEIAPENQSLTNHEAGEKQSPLPQEVSREENGGEPASGPAPSEPTEDGSAEAPLPQETAESSSSDAANLQGGGAAAPVPASGSGVGGAGQFSGAGANPVTGA